MNDCVTWASLSDKLALGEQLSPAERRYLQSHASGCHSCGVEAELWENLGQVLEEPARLTQVSSEASATWARPAPGFFGRWSPRRAWRSASLGSLVAAAALMAAGASAAILIRDAQLAETQPRLLVSVSRPALGDQLKRGSRQAPPREVVAEPEESLSPPDAKPARSVASSPTKLLEQARRLRAEGRYRDALAVYQRLLREHASSSEARVALVSLGELQLSQLGDAKGALRSFDGYLRAGGALSQEASYGRIRALRRLGQVGEARTAAENFVRRYPNSVQASSLRKELL